MPTKTLATPSATKAQTSLHLEYPHGTIKMTWAFGYPRNNDIKIEEVLRNSDLKVALLSSWQIDMDWIMAKINLQQTKLILAYGERDEMRQADHRNASKDWGKSLRLCFPPMGKGLYDCMHSKLMLLFYPNFLRVVVPSANLVKYDWGETGVMQNSVFLIDLPRLAGEKTGAKNSTLTPFASELQHFVNAMGVDENVTDPSQQLRTGLLNFDFTNTKHIAFVHSTGQTYWGTDNVQLTGYSQLAKSVRDLGLETKLNEPVQVDYAASSIGANTVDRLELMYRALQGLPSITPTSGPMKGTVHELGAPSKPLGDRFRIYYPSADTVQSSRGGPENGGTLFFSDKFDKTTKFPVSTLRDCISTREGLLSHCKLILVRTPRGAFVYTGSANLSQSAWGKMTWDREKKKPKLLCANWECGVLMRARKSDDKVQEDVDTQSEDGGEAAKMTLDQDGVVPLDSFKDILDIPFKIPARQYGTGLTPWKQAR